MCGYYDSNYINSLQSCCCNSNTLNNYTKLMICQSVFDYSEANINYSSNNYMVTNYVYPNSSF